VDISITDRFNDVIELAVAPAPLLDDKQQRAKLSKILFISTEFRD